MQNKSPSTFKSLFLHEPMDKTLRDKLSAALLDNIYRRLFFAQTTSLICGIIIFLGLYKANTDNSIIIAWFTFFILTIFLRSLAFIAYIRKNPSIENQLKIWKPIFILATFLGGITWGLVATVLYAKSSLTGQILIIIMIAGITAGSITALSAEIISTIMFLTCSLIPLFFMLITNKSTDIPAIFSVAVIIYYFYCIIAALRTHKMLVDNYLLTIKNDDLLKDLSEAKRQLEESNKALEKLATHDALTGLANRYLFNILLETSIKRADRSKKILALLYLDIDNFKSINDIYGHDAGDQLLKNVAKRIQQSIRAHDLAFRLGGDEFAIILEDFTHKNDISQVAKEICDNISKPMMLNNIEFKSTSSIGICIYPANGHDAHTLLKKADRAMYAVKDMGGNNYLYSD